MIIGGYPPVLMWPGTSAWATQIFWWYYLYSLDEEFLKETAYPFMRECMLFYEGLLERSANGKYHIFPTSCPEWGGFGDKYWGRDDTLALSLIRYLIDGLLKAADILEINEPHLQRWQAMIQNLPNYPTDETGLCVMEGIPYSHPSAHLSHLAPIYPCGDININGPAEHINLIGHSVNNLIEKGCSAWQGWAFVWASLIASRVGRGQMAYWTLKRLAESFLSCNTFNLNGDWKSHGLGRNSIVGKGSFVFSYCQDGNMAAVAAVNEMLLQSWGGRIRIFPGCPSHWRRARFDRLLCEGGIEVSAVRSEGRTLGVKLESKKPSCLRLQNPFDAEGGYISKRLIQPNREGDLELSLEAGAAVWITRTHEINPEELEEFTVERCESEQNPYGLKYLVDELFLDDFHDFEAEKK